MNPIKNLFLAAVGGTHLTYEKADEVLKTLIDKGQISVAEGKSLSEDIQRVAKGHADGGTPADPLEETLSERILALQTQVEKLTQEVQSLKENNTETVDNNAPENEIQ
jgi:polyhydroxyalkanoate synthesis regulator phasin